MTEQNLAYIRRPHLVSSWWNPIKDYDGEVWFNGRDGYNIYLDTKDGAGWKLIDTLYFNAPESETSCVSNACGIGYFRTMGKEFKIQKI